MLCSSIFIVILISAGVVHIAKAENPKFILYGASFDDNRTIDSENSASLTTDPYFNTEYPTVTIVLGYNQNLNIDFYRDYISSFIEAYHENNNVMVYDWSDAANAYLAEEKKKLGVTSPLLVDYLPIVLVFMDIATKMLSKALVDINGSYNLEKMYFVSHSLGVHVSGVACRQAYAGGTKKCGRHINLDPASLGVKNPARASDGICTMSVSTDPYGYGSRNNDAHANFFVNKKYYDCNSAQPGCSPTLLNPLAKPCSHRLPIFFFSETNRNHEAIMASQADSCKNWYNGIQGQKVYLTVFMQPCPSGTLYFCTASEPNYALGAAGIIPSNCEPADCLLACLR